MCTGSLLLAAAGLLEGRRATSHWLILGELAAFGAEPTGERVVVDGGFITAAGVSAGIDMGLALVGRIAGDEHAQAVQLMTEYDPRPPYDAGSPQKAPAALVDRLRAESRLVLRWSGPVPGAAAPAGAVEACGEGSRRASGRERRPRGAP